MSVLYQWLFQDWSNWEIFFVAAPVLAAFFILLVIATSLYKRENDWGIARRASWMRRVLQWVRRLLQRLLPRQGNQFYSTVMESDIVNDQHFTLTELKKHVQRIDRKLDDQNARIKTELRASLREELIILLQRDAEVKRLLGHHPGQGGATPIRSTRLGESTDAHKSTQGHQATRPDATSGKYLEMRDLYNNSLTDQGRRTEFRERYRPITISVVNAVDRRRDENLPPVYQTSSDGNFLAVILNSGGEYAVFPNFGISLEASSHDEGAMGEVFPCSEFDRRYSYPNIRVETPAIFVKRSDDGWELNTPGVLQLGQPREI